MTPEEVKRKADAAEERSQTDEKGRFVTGSKGGPGRSKGSRNKLGEAFVQALYNDFETFGVGVIERVREEKPDQYLKVVASLLPKELKITDERDLTDDQLIERIRRLDDQIRPFLDALGAGEAGGGTETSVRH